MFPFPRSAGYRESESWSESPAAARAASLNWTVSCGWFCLGGGAGDRTGSATVVYRLEMELTPPIIALLLDYAYRLKHANLESYGEVRAYEDVRENSESRPENELLFCFGSTDPAIRSTRAATLLPKLLDGDMGFPSIRAF